MTAGSSSRIVSLDQFRGYTVLGMFLVNFIGHFDVITTYAPVLKHHNTYCSYADTIMPHFLFAVGAAYRLTLRRRLAHGDGASAYFRVVRRNLGLILLGVVIYHLDVTMFRLPDGSAKPWARLVDDFHQFGWWAFVKSAFEREPFQTLVHIGVTSLWVLPVIALGPGVRFAFLLFSAALHLYLSKAFYYDWVWNRPGIDGGPLGFLTWTIPLLAGSFAYDLVAGNSKSRAFFLTLGWGGATMIVGYALSCLTVWTPLETANVQGLPLRFVEPPFVPPSDPINLWTMSQRAGSVSYLTFGAGISFAVYAMFILICDMGGRELPIFRTLGNNALAAYIIHLLVMQMVKPLCPHDAPWWFAGASCGFFLFVTYLFVRHLERNGLYLRL
jgi:predicted acyltransferase